MNVLARIGSRISGPFAAVRPSLAGLRASLRVALVTWMGFTGLAVAPLHAQAAKADIATDVKVPTVTVAGASMAEVVGQVSVSGSLVARNEVLIYPQVSGFSIETLAAQVGDRVEVGDVLATLATRNLSVQVAQARAELARAEAAVRQAQSQIETAQAGLTQAEAQLSRNRQLTDRGVGTQTALDAAVADAATARAAFASATDGLAVAQAQRDQAQAQLDLAQLNLDHTRIASPVSGIVSARNGKIGAIAASAGDPIYRVIAEGAIDVELQIIESSLGDVSVGNPVSLDIASVGRVSGSVERIAPTVDPVNRLTTVTVRIEPDPALRPGLYASGTIEVARRQSLTVPTTAVLSDSTGTYVLKVENGIIRRQPVVAGLIWRDSREVIEGLTEADRVVARAGAFFADGDRVNTIDAGQDGASVPDPAGETASAKDQSK